MSLSELLFLNCSVGNYYICDQMLLHLWPNVITLVTLLHLWPVITFVPSTLGSILPSVMWFHYIIEFFLIFFMEELSPVIIGMEEKSNFTSYWDVWTYSLAFFS